METPAPTLPMIGDISLFSQSREELNKALAVCVGQPVEMPAQTICDERRELRRAAGFVWLYSFLLLIFAIASFYSAWDGFGSSDWGWYWVAAVLAFFFSALLS